mgnify:CR=1 FL=1
MDNKGLADLLKDNRPESIELLADVKPVYCTVTIQRQCEITIEGWLFSTDSEDYFAIQPSIDFDPAAAKFLIGIDDVLTIYPAHVPDKNAPPVVSALPGYLVPPWQPIPPVTNTV